MDLVYYKLYKSFFLEIDAIDNGVNEAENPLYYVSTGLSSRIHRFNKAWNDKSESTFNDYFKKAMKVTEEELL